MTAHDKLGAFAQLLHAAIDLGVARAAFRDTLEFLRGPARAWVDSGVARAAEDPLTIAAVGDLGVRLSGAEALVERAALRVDEAGRAPDERSCAGASIAVAEARVATTQAALAAANKLFELAGSRATLAELGLDRHWRSARTHTLHDPVRWKYHAIGNYLLNGVAPPRHGAV